MKRARCARIIRLMQQNADRKASIADVKVVWRRTTMEKSADYCGRKTRRIIATKHRTGNSACGCREPEWFENAASRRNRLPKSKSELRAALSAYRKHERASPGRDWLGIDCYKPPWLTPNRESNVDPPIEGFQVVQEKLFDMVNEITRRNCSPCGLTRMIEAGTARPNKSRWPSANNAWMALNARGSARIFWRVESLIAIRPSGI